MDLRDAGKIQFHVGQVNEIIGTDDNLTAVKCIKENKIQELEKILISEKEFELPPKNNIYIKRPFRFIELVEVLHSMAERLKNKKDEIFFWGYLSFIIPDRKLSYKDKNVVELTEKESDIIVSLFNSSDRGITKEELM